MEKSKIEKSIELHKIEWQYSKCLSPRCSQYRHSILSGSIDFSIFDFFQIRVYYGEIRVLHDWSFWISGILKNGLPEQNLDNVASS